jgi:hypothetical protein
MRRYALLVSIAFLVLVPRALADGGPDPGVIQAGSGISNTGSGVRYATVQGGSVTTLEAIATQGGQILNARPFNGGWGIPLVDYTGGVGGLSENGRTLVLAQSGYDGVCTPSNCTPLRRTSRFQIINPRTLRSRFKVRLPGDFAYDALSPNGQRLYLIEHTSTTNTNKYIVRAYNLKQHRLLPGAIADRTQRGWIMQGIPMARATSTDGRYVYTIYANPGGYPFVHALDTVAARAHCIGIPWTREQSLGDLDQLRLSTNGRTLTIGGTSSSSSLMNYFTLDTRSYRVSPITAPAPSGFPWWTLSLLALLLLPPAFLLTRRRRTSGRDSKRQPLPHGAG